MRTYTVTNLSAREFFTFIAPESNWLKELEDQLYIHWELTRVRGSRSMESLLEGFPVIFTYHNLEYVEISLKANGLIVAFDLP